MANTVITATYVGRRTTVENRLCYAYKVGDEAALSLYTKPLFPALIGEKWTIEKDEKGSVFLKTAKRIQEPIDRETANEWEAEDVAHLQRDVERKFAAKLKNRETEFAKALTPIKTMCNGLKYHEDRAAFIQRVVSELWRR